MDFFEKSGVNVLRSVIVSGVTHTSKDDEIFNVLKQYGRYKLITVADETCPFFKNLVVEYKTDSAIAELKKILPYTHISESDSELEFCVTLPQIESTGSAGAEVFPPDYMKELKLLARRSGQKFECVLQDVLFQINEHLVTLEGEPHSGDTEQGGDSVQNVDPAAFPPGQQGLPAGAIAQSEPSTAPSNSSREHQRLTSPPQRIPLSHADLNPPDVQRVIVEHVVRADEHSIHSIPTLRLRPFSGKIPKPANETDYETWRSHIELLLADVNLPPIQVTRRIIESLLSPATDVVKGLKPDTVPSVYLQMLDSAYSTVQDGEELFAQFLNTLQDPGEKPSSYLQRLLLTLNTVVKRGGVAASDIDKHVLKQFCRGCWDNGIITKLQLEQKRENPPAFAELLLLLRTEEDRQLAKESLMKKHIGSSKQRAALQAQTCSCSHTDTAMSSINELKQQVKKLQQQMSALLVQTARTSRTPSHNKPSTLQLSSGRTHNVRPRAWFCFKCGEDGHIATNCNQLANLTLVQQKKLQLQQRQGQWDKNNNQKQSN
uniref:Uncharacterized LOC110962134 n=1 Tax=Acanthochromis polyacanthus TaxID=80966 RepID=A0A3Q1EWY3_9TELE